ncbi:hypothetical protein V8G54_001998 [Vigna mungo]|uniref:Knottins-like domain-containing protein n=1 Tax=Vigna mungo TaxID=3915 RepID=A0AAQ3S8Q3_VIGMU
MISTAATVEATVASASAARIINFHGYGEKSNSRVYAASPHNLCFCVKRTEARGCLTPSQSFKGLCISNENCKAVCSTEGFNSGKCEVSSTSQPPRHQWVLKRYLESVDDRDLKSKLGKEDRSSTLDNRNILAPIVGSRTRDHSRDVEIDAGNAGGNNNLEGRTCCGTKRTIDSAISGTTYAPIGENAQTGELERTRQDASSALAKTTCMTNTDQGCYHEGTIAIKENAPPDPDEHLRSFVNAMTFYSSSDLVWCKLSSKSNLPRLDEDQLICLTTKNHGRVARNGDRVHTHKGNVCLPEVTTKQGGIPVDGTLGTSNQYTPLNAPRANILEEALTPPRNIFPYASSGNLLPYASSLRDNRERERERERRISDSKEREKKKAIGKEDAGCMVRYFSRFSEPVLEEEGNKPTMLLTDDASDRRCLQLQAVTSGDCRNEREPVVVTIWGIFGEEEDPMYFSRKEGLCVLEWGWTAEVCLKLDGSKRMLSSISPNVSSFSLTKWQSSSPNTSSPSAPFRDSNRSGMDNTYLQPDSHDKTISTNIH